MEDLNNPNKTPDTNNTGPSIQEHAVPHETKTLDFRTGQAFPIYPILPKNKAHTPYVSGGSKSYGISFIPFTRTQRKIIKPTIPIQELILSSKENRENNISRNMNDKSVDYFKFNFYTFAKLNYAMEEDFPGPFVQNTAINTDYFPSDRLLYVERHLNSLYLLVNSKPLQYAPSHLAQFLFQRYKLAYTGENLMKLEKKKNVLQNKINQQKHTVGSMIKKSKSKLVRTHIEYQNKECRWTSNYFLNFTKSRKRKIDNIIKALGQKEKTNKNAIIKEQKNNAKKISRELKVTMKNILKLVKAKSELYKKKTEKNEILSDLTELFGNAARISQVITSLLKETNETPWDPSKSKLLKLGEDKPLREYQIRGVSWLLGLFKNNTNGILADDMGLGKTVQTIALFSRLAEEYDMWGPYLIIVPNSVVINWSVEFKKWMPGFKLLVYHGNQNQRKAKRVGWNKKNAFNAVIVGYSTAVNDISFIKRRKWLAMVLDEAHSIKNSSSKRWQQLLSIKAHRRILLTGTPLQNSVMELWALLHFLMPGLFKSSEAFKEWFSKPLSAKNLDITGAMKEITDGSTTSRSEKLAITRLKGLIMPFVLRRLKTEVNLGLPPKTEELIVCRFSKRQRQLYEDFLSRGKTKRVIKEGKYLNMMGVLTKLRKVCNHPDLFEGKSVTTPLRFSLLSDFDEFSGLFKCEINQKVLNNISYTSVFKETIPDNMLGIDPNQDTVNEDILAGISKSETPIIKLKKVSSVYTKSGITIRKAMLIKNNKSCMIAGVINRTKPLNMFLVKQPFKKRCPRTDNVNIVKDIVSSKDYNNFIFKVPTITRKINLTELLYYNKYKPHEEMAFSATRYNHLLNTKESLIQKSERNEEYNKSYLACLKRGLKYSKQRKIPDPISLLNECGKLQRLERLLETLTKQGHRCVIFSLMVKMLDIIEFFLSRQNFSYLRLDGSTPLELRQARIDRFNADPKIFCFITSTRSGGLGINLTGADTVIFYDSDWNPSVDLQAQDRCHRLGQKKPVKIYKLITENTIEANIYCVSERKKRINRAVLDDGDMGVFDEESAVFDIFKGMGGDALENIEEIANKQKEENENMVVPIETEKPKSEQQNEFLDLISEQVDEKLQRFNQLYDGLSPLEKYLFNKIENNPAYYSEEPKNSLAPEARCIERFSGASAHENNEVKRVLVSLGIRNSLEKKTNPFKKVKTLSNFSKIHANVEIYKQYFEEKTVMRNYMKIICNIWRTAGRKRTRLEKLTTSATEKPQFTQRSNAKSYNNPSIKPNYNMTNVSINSFPNQMNGYPNNSFANYMSPMYSNNIIRKNKYDKLLNNTTGALKGAIDQEVLRRKNKIPGPVFQNRANMDFEEDFLSQQFSSHGVMSPNKKMSRDRVAMGRMMYNSDSDMAIKQEVSKHDEIYLQLINDFIKVEELNLLLFKFLDSYMGFAGKVMDQDSTEDLFGIVNGLFTTESHIHAFYEYVIARCSPKLKKYMYVDLKQNHLYFIAKLNKLAENNFLKYNILREELELEINIFRTNEKVNLFNKYKLVSHRAIQQQAITNKKLMLCSKMLLNQRGTPINGTNIIIRKNTPVMEMNSSALYSQPATPHNNNSNFKTVSDMANKSQTASNYPNLRSPEGGTSRVVSAQNNNKTEVQKEEDLKIYIARYINAPSDLKKNINYIAERPDINVDQKIEMIKQLTE